LRTLNEKEAECEERQYEDESELGDERDFEREQESDDDFRRDWRRKLDDEYGDDLADAFGTTAWSQNFKDDDLIGDSRETFDQWADRIYGEFCRRKMQLKVTPETTSKKPEMSSARTKLPGKLKEPPSLATTSPTLRAKYLQFCREILQGNCHIGLKEMPFSADMPSAAVAEAVFGSLDAMGESQAKEAIKRALLTFHPDKFMQRYGQRIKKCEKESIVAIVVHVSQSLLAFRK